MAVLEANDETVRGISFRIETITPAVAAKYLATSRVNRAPNLNTVSQLARDMADGRWLLTNDAVAFNADGNLVNGQHRCLACVRSGVPFSVLTVMGLDEEAQLAMDSPRKRTLANQLGFIGEINTRDLAAAISACWQYDNGRRPGQSTMPSVMEAIAWLDENPGVRDSARLGKRMTKRYPPISGRPVALVHYITSRVDPVAADDFFEMLASGVGLEDGDAILAMRRWVQGWWGKRDQPQPRLKMHATMHACNLWRSGATAKIIRVRVSDPFPRVWGEDVRPGGRG